VTRPERRDGESKTNRLTGQVALVTGGSRGIGRATALRLAREGAAVVVHYRRDAEAARSIVAEIESEGGRARAVAAELGDAEALEAMFRTVAAHEGRLDVLVANAAATAFRPLLETKPHNVEKTFGITVSGFLRCVQLADPLFSEGARIVAVSGFDSIRVVPRHGTLGAAKAAMETLVRYLAVELAPRGIRVNGVNPGFVETDSARRYAGAEYESRTRGEWIAITPLRRVAEPREIASVIAFLCGDDSSFVTGQTLIADGGLTLGGGWGAS
jgi:enoyl-[acyl-carrier protein] reductase III